MVLVIALAVPDLVIFYWRDAYPNIYPSLKIISFLSLIVIITFPSDIIYMLCESSPYVNIVSPSLNTIYFIVVDKANFCLFVKHVNIGTFYTVFTFLEYSDNLIFWRVFRYRDGLIIKNLQFFSLQIIEAVLAHLNNRASSPKVFPYFNVLTIFFPIYTYTEPLYMIKKQFPISPWLKIYFWGYAVAHIIS